MPQGLVPPPQTPVVQVWVPLQKLVSSQLVPLGWKPSVGQSLPTPSQLSATSQTPAEARHWAVLLPSFGQSLEEPSQASAVSQTPADPRQVVPFGSTASAGHAALTPSQFSVASQVSPVLAARHTVLLGSSASAGQVRLVPSQVSTMSHTPAELRHTVVLGSTASA